MSATLAVSPIRIPLEEGSANFLREPARIAERVRSRESACLRVLGGSMFPWIRPGDLLFVRRFAFQMISPGDIILFQRDERFFVHRVIRRIPARANVGAHDSLITKGDALDGEDAPISEADFLGRAIRIHRRRRHIDLLSLGQSLLGRIIARGSRWSAVVYGPLRFCKRLLFA
ncbi:MAG: signal peptidase I [Candidatus Acidiferrales bacterium]